MAVRENVSSDSLLRNNNVQLPLQSSGVYKV